MEPSANLGPWELIKGQIAYDIYLFQCNVYIICTAAIQQLPVRWLWKGFAFLIDSHSLDRIPLFLFFVAIIYHQRIIIEFYRILLLEVMLVFPKKGSLFYTSQRCSSTHWCSSKGQVGRISFSRRAVAQHQCFGKQFDSQINHKGRFCWLKHAWRLCDISMCFGTTMKVYLVTRPTSSVG